MSTTANPYASSSLAEPFPGKTEVRPIELLQRSFEMIRGEYWLFLGITLVGMLIAAAVPFGILQGPMMVGFFLCFAQRQQTGRTEFGTLFKGFDQFFDAFIAMLIMVAASFVVMIPLMIVFFAIMVVAIATAGPNGGNAAPIGMIVAMLGLFPLIMAAVVAIYMPFVFTFQLIADRKMSAGAAVKASAHAAWNNLGGLLWYFFVTGFIMFLAMLPCYLPAILLMPIAIGGAWLLYQDIFATIAK